MSQYDDVLLRDNLSDTGVIPTPGALSHSPDIIPYGLEPENDPQKFFSGNYGSDVGKDLVANARNYFYVRGKNLGQKSTSGSFYLYYSKASLLLYPNQWQNNALKTSTGESSVPFNVNSNKIAVATDPFTWVPQIISGDHYCMVGRVVTPDHPNEIPPTGDIQDFAGWVANNGGICWRNVAVVDTGSPTWTQNVDYDQGVAGDKVQFIITCTNVPVGAKVSFSAGTPGPTPLIDLQPTAVTNSTSFVVGVECDVPANYKTNISYSYWANGAPPKGFSIKMSAQVVVPPGHANYAFARTLEEVGIPKKSDDPEHHKMLNALHDSIGPSKVIVVGEHYSIGG